MTFQLTDEERRLLIEFEKRGLFLPSTDRFSRWCPQHPTPKQLEFVESTELECLFGGALGGGKSSAMLMAALAHVDHPNYSALIVRQTYQELSQPGCLIPRSHEWLHGTGAHWNEQKKQWRFPSGAVLRFGHLDGPNAHFNYQSSEFQFIGIDEAGLIPWHQLHFLITRLRRPAGSQIPLRFRLTANPGGQSHDELKARYIDSADHRYIPSLLFDNPHLDIESYKEQLEGMLPLQRAQLLHGDWSAVPEGVFCKPGDFQYCKPEDLPRFTRYFRCWDLAFALDGDYTVGVLMARAGQKFYVLDVRRARLESPDVQTLILATASGDPERTIIGIEAAGFGTGLIQDLARNSSFDVYEASFSRQNQLTIPLYSRKPALVSVNVAGKDKATRCSGFLARLARGDVILKAAAWNTAYINEFASFTNEKWNTDDQVDATSIAFLLSMKTRGAVEIEDVEAPYKSKEWWDNLREDLEHQRRMNSWTDGAEAY